MSEVECYICHKKGHIATNCPNKKKKGSENVNLQTTKNDENNEDGEEYVNLQIEEKLLTSFDFCCLTVGDEVVMGNVSDKNTEVVMYQGNKINKSWVILDNGSTVDIFCNGDLLENVRSTNHTIRVRCNAGVTETNMKGDLPGYGTVWYNPKGMANILSLARVSEKYKITYDSESGQGFRIHKDDGSTLFFKRNHKGLFYMDMSDEENVLVNIVKEIKNSETDGVILISTVMDNAEVFSKKEIERAKLARKLQGTLGHPSTLEFIKLVEKGLLGNCPIEPQDIRNADIVFGPSLFALKGKAVRRANMVVNVNNNHVPLEIMDKCEDLVICGDIMFVNKIPFFITITRKLNFGAVETFKNREIENVIKAMKNVTSIYNKRGIKLKMALMDGEFEVMRGKLAEMGMESNCASRDEHVPEIERYIRTVKERVRCMLHSTPYKIFPRVILIEAAKAGVFWLNYLPSLNGMSET
jgi:hypothetical protein